MVCVRVAAIAEMLNAGRSYSEIGNAVGVSSGALTKIRSRLAEQGLLTAKPDRVEAGEGQPPMTLDPTRQVDEMLKAGSQPRRYDRHGPANSNVGGDQTTPAGRKCAVKLYQLS